MKKVQCFILMAVILCSSMWSATVQAQSGYFNTYTTYSAMSGSGFYTSMQGMAVDRNNNMIYAAKINTSNHLTQLYAIKMNGSSSNRTVKLLKNSDTNSTSNDLGHANDLAVKAQKGDDQVSLYVAPMSDGVKYVKKIVKLSVNTKKNTYKVAKSYVLPYQGANLSISGITYSVGADKFIVRSGNRFFIGNFNDQKGQFEYEATFTLNDSKAIVNQSVVDVSKYILQGISFYQGTLYVPLSKPDSNGGASNVSVILTYPLNINQMLKEQKETPAKDFSKELFTRKDLSFRITSSAFTLFEIEAVDFDDGTLYFNTNRGKNATQEDMIATFNDYNYYK
ncbi:hypothetical protein QLH48_09840 [Bacillus safensis]|nr:MULTISPECIES: hypothetical protein [Bacillus]MBL4984316.1 hypothetical protein [Bacillus safensis]MCM3367653.1 hypothetical protein [Bacillus safensis]MDJ0290762.1 hypothetical protein [Bacillus safensis]